MSEEKISIPKGYKVIGIYRRNNNYVYLKSKYSKSGVAIPFCLNDPTFNIDDLQLCLFD